MHENLRDVANIARKQNRPTAALLSANNV